MLNHFYPLNKVPIDLNSHSWFDLNIIENNFSLISNSSFCSDFIKTFKYKIYPTDFQKNILLKWFSQFISIYNSTNEYLKTHIYDQNNKLKKNYKKYVNFYNLRSKYLRNKLDFVKSQNDIPKHSIDYAVKQCVEMYKSAISNLKNKNIKHFDIKNLDLNRNRKNFILEPNTFSKIKNGFCVKKLGEMKSDVKLYDNINNNVILQYNKNKNTFFLIVPKYLQYKANINRCDKTGIDIGVRTFITSYSVNETYQIGNNITPIIDKYLAKKDKLKSDLDNKKMNKRKFKKAFKRNTQKMDNKIDDLHKKVANLLLKKYDIINIGKVSIKNMISNLTGNIKEKTKRRLMVLKHYKFREYLKLQSKKWEVIINEINEYKTSITCSKCGKEKKDLKGNKVYECERCKMKIDRDINASINIQKI